MIYRYRFGNYKIVTPGKVSSKNCVPNHILKPSYALTGIPCNQIPGVPEVKDDEQICRMKEACSLASDILKKVKYWLEVKYSCEYFRTKKFLINFPFSELWLKFYVFVSTVIITADFLVIDGKIISQTILLTISMICYPKTILN